MEEEDDDEETRPPKVKKTKYCLVDTMMVAMNDGDFDDEQRSA